MPRIKGGTTCEPLSDKQHVWCCLFSVTLTTHLSGIISLISRRGTEVQRREMTHLSTQTQVGLIPKNSLCWTLTHDLPRPHFFPSPPSCKSTRGTLVLPVHCLSSGHTAVLPYPLHLSDSRPFEYSLVCHLFREALPGRLARQKIFSRTEFPSLSPNAVLWSFALRHPEEMLNSWGQGPGPSCSPLCPVLPVWCSTNTC